MGTIEDLADRAEIGAVMSRYAHACDRGDREMAKACYHPDATDDHGRVSGTVDEVFDFLGRYSDGVRATYHFLGVPLVELDGDVADVETYCLYHREDKATGPETAVMQGLRYVDRFERREGRWLIASRVVVLDWEHETGPLPAAAAPESWIRGSKDNQDPASPVTAALRRVQDTP